MARWQRTRLPSDKNTYNNLTSLLKRHQFRSDSFNEWILSLTTKDGSLWKATRKCLKQKPLQGPLKNNHDALETWPLRKAEETRLKSLKGETYGKSMTHASTFTQDNAINDIIKNLKNCFKDQISQKKLKKEVNMGMACVL
ncbi:Hypothetical protein CINCED_3A009816 [Cinara cedri]|uniref:Uncharacterized protein n=1 Tax=Cinara cedri TaxID=506608 RepID=A0A5E4NC58_9HEMI|nr:Hypothetical protein CINCED_3A009816 [Cinara cedri]